MTDQTQNVPEADSYTDEPDMDKTGEFDASVLDEM